MAIFNSYVGFAMAPAELRQGRRALHQSLQRDPGDAQGVWDLDRGAVSQGPSAQWSGGVVKNSTAVLARNTICKYQQNTICRMYNPL